MYLSKREEETIQELCRKLETSCDEVVQEQRARVIAECPGLLPVIDDETRGWETDKTATLMACLAITPLPRRPVIACPSANDETADREGRFMPMHRALDVSFVSLYLLGAQGRRADLRDVSRAYGRIHHAIRSAR